MIFLDPPEWNSADVTALRAFLGTSSGRKILGILANERPSFLPPSAHPHKSFAQARDIAGYEQCLTNFVALTAPVESPLPEKPEAYPDLDDESKWPGEKLS